MRIREQGGAPAPADKIDAEVMSQLMPRLVQIVRKGVGLPTKVRRTHPHRRQHPRNRTCNGAAGKPLGPGWAGGPPGRHCQSGSAARTAVVRAAGAVRPSAAAGAVRGGEGSSAVHPPAHVGGDRAGGQALHASHCRQAGRAPARRLPRDRIRWYVPLGRRDRAKAVWHAGRGGGC